MKDHSLDSMDLLWLAGLARALVGDAAAGEDLAQDAALAALQGPGPSHAPPRAWLAGVTRRMAARRFRDESRRRDRERNVAQPEALPDSAELVERAEIAETVTAAARRLPEPFRSTILLRFLEGLEPHEIAEREGKPVDTVRWRVRRGLDLLREELVRSDDRDWSAWCALLLPLARVGADAGTAAAGATGAVLGSAAAWTVMKVGIAALVVLSGAGLWALRSSSANELDLRVERDVATLDVDRVDDVRPSVELQPVEEIRAGQGRVEVDESGTVPTAPASETPAADDFVFGRVVDVKGEPVAEATVFLVGDGTSVFGTGAPVNARRTTGESGSFRFGTSSVPDALADTERSVRLVVAANGFTRRVVASARRDQPADGWRIELDAGLELVGRVVDEYGEPATNIQLLAFTQGAGIDHVSPSQRRLQSDRALFETASGDYEQCLAKSRSGGSVRFSGLAPGMVSVRSLDPGWTIEGPGPVPAGGPFVEWTAKRRLGVRITVVDARTRAPLDCDGATFLVGLGFDDGSSTSTGQWVGRGRGEVSLVLGAGSLPDYGDRTITRADFYGTVSAGLAEVEWKAPRLEDPRGILGVAELTVAIDPTVPSGDAEATEEERAEPPVAALEVDVRYDDGTIVDGNIVIEWSVRPDVGQPRKGRARPNPIGPGRYRIDVVEGDVSLRVKGINDQGSLDWWSGKIRAQADRTAIAYATLERGGKVIITRPEGWTGVWRLHASYRESPDEDWFGAWNYGTPEETLVLTALKPAEWRFRLRRTESDPNPIIRTVVLEEGDEAIVD
ncbi:MAG: sigma-70 family RNA polymerase sigma factor [Planctomycetota bacterium]